MNKKIFMNYSIRDLLITILPIGVIVVAVLLFAFKQIQPAPPNHLVISTGDDQVDLEEFAKQYQTILKQDGVKLEIRSSTGPSENLLRLQDENSGVSVAFVPDGFGSPEDQPDIASLGSLYYEPIWIFYRSKKIQNHISMLNGKRIAVGRVGHGTHAIAQRLLELSGVDLTVTKLVHADAATSAQALKHGDVDAAIFMLSPENPIVHDLAIQKDLRLMNLAQAEAISRKDPTFENLRLPRGALDLGADIPNEEIHLVASTTTLVIRDDLHPALVFLLLKAAAQLHGGSGILEKGGEFPNAKVDVFPLSEDAIQFYKSGGPFWQRFLPYWLAAWLDRFILLVIPIVALVLPLIRLVPILYNWRMRSRIYQRYGELKYLETQIKDEITRTEYQNFLNQLDLIEDRVNKMKLPGPFTEYVYSLKVHIQLVRNRLEKKSHPS